MHVNFKNVVFLRMYKILFLVFVLAGCSVPQNQFIDLDFMRDQVVENHPGMCNVLDPSFKDELEKAYLVARDEIGNSPSQQQKKEALTQFAKSFNDAHVWLFWKDLALNNSRKQHNQKFKIKHVNPSTVWITLPTFELNNFDQQKSFEHILNELSVFKNKRVIVFDLRGNQGGNSEYGDQIVDHLFGAAYANQQRRIATQNVSVDWRASQGNLRHIREMYARCKSDWMKQVADAMEESIKSHEPYYHATPADTIEPNEIARTHNVTAKIVVIIDRLNVSAALDFIDSLKMMEHPITLIGKKTKSDRLYMEVRTVNLPSGLGTFSYPIKVYRNRPRGDNVPYVPDFECDIDDVKELEKYVKEIT